MRTILSGVVLEDYISLRTLAAKAGGLSLGLGSGLPVGSEGPFVHIACTLANQFMRLPPFAAIAHSDELRRAIMSASCAVGVCAAAPHTRHADPSRSPSGVSRAWYGRGP